MPSVSKEDGGVDKPETAALLSLTSVELLAVAADKNVEKKGNE